MFDPMQSAKVNSYWVNVYADCKILAIYTGEIMKCYDAVALVAAMCPDIIAQLLQ
jgi:hypothetical protein